MPNIHLKCCIDLTSNPFNCLFWNLWAVKLKATAHTVHYVSLANHTVAIYFTFHHFLIALMHLIIEWRINGVNVANRKWSSSIRMTRITIKMTEMCSFITLIIFLKYITYHTRNYLHQLLKRCCIDEVLLIFAIKKQCHRYTQSADAEVDFLFIFLF